jgi:hypothetical protein
MRSSFRRPDRGNETVAPPDLRLYSVGLFAVLAAIVLFASFAEHPDCLFTGTDGNTLSILLDTEKLFRIPFSQLGVSPIEGNFDAYFTLNRDYLLSETIGRIFAGGTPSKPLTFAVCSMFLVICGYAMARAVGASRVIASSTGLLLPLVIMPVFQSVPILVDGALFNINPYFSQGIGLSLLIICAFWRLSGRWDAAGLGWMIMPLACVTVTMTSQPQTAVVMLPGIAVYGAASLFDAKNWRQNVQRFIAGALVVAAAVTFGFVEYEIGLAKYTAYYLFQHEFGQNRGELFWASMVFQGRLGILIVCLAYLGALYSILVGPGRLRVLAIAFILSTSAYLILAYAIVAWASGYRGISPAYFETYLLPFHLLFAVIAVAGLLHELGVRLPLTPLMRDRLARLLSYVLVATPMIAMASWNLVYAHSIDQWHCRRGGFPIAPTPITSYLVSKIASAPGQDFRGLVATFNGYVDINTVDVDRLQDGNLWYAIGNDHRDVGLWHFHIPTLLQYSPFITPPYFLLLTEFASRPTDIQVRDWIVLTRINERMLKLWGVRYIITDFDPGIGSLVLEMKVPDKHELPQKQAELFSNISHPSPIQRLTELDAPNLGNYSPTEIRHATNFASGLMIMREPDFDGRHIVVTDESLPGGFLPATASRLTLTKSGFMIHASSTGQSVLVLPIQYSHCWTALDPHVQLFRADLMQLGIRFTGTLDAELVFRFGPLFAGRCRLEDVYDMDRLKIMDARAR